MKAFPDDHDSVDRLFAEDDWVIELMTPTATHLGRAQAPHHDLPPGLEPAGQSFRVAIVRLTHPGRTPTPYSVAEYKNMVGRAGRLGLTERGESYLIPEGTLEQLFGGRAEDLASSAQGAERSPQFS